MDKDKSWIVLLVIGIVAAYLLNLGGLYDTVCGNYNICIGATGGSGGTGGGTGGGTTPPASDICIYDGATMTIGPMQEKWNPTTDVTDRAARVYVNGVDRGVKADGATMDVNYKDVIDIYYGENETVGASLKYYTNKDSFVVPCTASFSSADQGDGELLYNRESSSGDLAVKLFQEDDGLIMSSSAQEDLNSGDVITLQGSFHPAFEDAWSPSCPGIAVIEGNSTAFDLLKINGWETASIPAQHSIFATTNEAWAYKVPAFTIPADGAYSPVPFSITIDAATATLSGTNLFDGNITFYDCDWYRDSNTGEMKQGVESDTKADVGQDNFVYLLYFT